MTRRTVLQVIPELDTGGAERTAVDVALALVAAGHRAIVASQGGRLVGEIVAGGAEHVTLPLKRKAPLALWHNARALRHLVRGEGVDLVHARSRAPAWSALRAARAEGVPFVTTYHGIYNQSNAAKALYNSVMARGDAVIANSHYTARLIAERHPFAKGRITVIHRGSDLGALDPAAVSAERRQVLANAWGLAGSGKVILNLARLTHWKGQGVLVEALTRLATEVRSRGAEPDWTCILAGDAQGRTAYVAELEQRIAAAGLSGHVRLVGHCADVGAALALADVAVVASVEPEAFGRAAVEAQAACVPVIATDLGAAPETVLAPPDVAEDERTGWRVPPGDASALAAAIAAVLSGTGAPATAGVVARARVHVATHFSVGAMCAATLAVYDRLLTDG